MVKIEKQEFSNSCKEVLEILKYINEEDLERIPDFEIEILQKNANKDYEFIYNPNKTMNEQNVSKIAKSIIAIYFEKYTATEKQKQIINSKRMQDNALLEKRKSEEFGQIDLFEGKSKDRLNDEYNNELVIVGNKKWYQKLWKKIKRIIWKR